MSSVRIVEVGPRDGLQNEAETVATDTKIELIDRLSRCGLKHIEVSSLVSPKWVPQLADAEEVFRSIHKEAGVAYSLLIPNLRGMERALALGVKEIAVFTAASDTFNQKNINCATGESLERIHPVMEQALEHGIRVRGYVSCALGCPYEGEVPLDRVAWVSSRLLEMGCDEISLGDTIGVGTPIKARAMVECVAREVPLERLAVHFHDTRGQALANIFACLELGVQTVDAAVAGLGGCPYAPGAGGNVATEDVVYMLEGMGLDTGIDLDALIKAGRYICAKTGRTNQSKVGRIVSEK